MSHHAGALLIETFSVGILVFYNLLSFSHLLVSVVLTSTFTVQGLWFGIPQITKPWKHILMEKLLDNCMFPKSTLDLEISWAEVICGPIIPSDSYYQHLPYVFPSSKRTPAWPVGYWQWLKGLKHAFIQVSCEWKEHQPNYRNQLLLSLSLPGG